MRHGQVITGREAQSDVFVSCRKERDVRGAATVYRKDRSQMHTGRERTTPGSGARQGDVAQPVREGRSGIF